MADDDDGRGPGTGVTADSGRTILPAEPGQGRHEAISVSTGQFVPVNSADTFVIKQRVAGHPILSPRQADDGRSGEALRVVPVRTIAACRVKRRHS